MYLPRRTPRARGLFRICEIQPGGTTCRAFAVEVSPLLADAFLVSGNPAVNLDGGVAVAIQAFEVVAVSPVLNRELVAGAVTTYRDTLSCLQFGKDAVRVDARGVRVSAARERKGQRQ